MRKSSSTLRSNRVIGMIAAFFVAIAGIVGISAPAQGVGETTPIVDYDFGQIPADGQSVPNLVEGSAFGPAVVQNPSADLWGNGALTLTGGAKSGTGSWVLLPEDLLTESASATVQMEVKADAVNLSRFHFVWNIGNSSSQTEYFFTAMNCANSRSPLVGMKLEGSEALVQSGSCVVPADEWISFTAVADGPNGNAKLYVNGVEVASGNIAGGPNEILDQSLNTIGRAPWPDPMFVGEVANFRIFDGAMSPEEIQAISDQDALLHADEILASAQASLDSLVVPTEIDVPYVGLPTLGGTVTWESSAPDVVNTAGRVAQPAAGEEPIEVTLTATTTLRGQVATKDFIVTVLPTTQTAEEVAQQVFDTYVIPPVLQSGTTLPQPSNGTVEFIAGDGITVTDGVVTASQNVTSTIDAVLTSGSSTVTKQFTVRVLPSDSSQQLVSYHRTPTSDRVANNGDVAYSMHMALGDGQTWDPLNENYGIFFARTSRMPTNAVDVRLDTHRSLKDPALFYMKDGSYGIVAVRTDRGTGNRDTSVADSFLFATSDDLLSFNEEGNSRSMIRLPETNGVNNPNAVYDSANDYYIVTWQDDGGVPKWTTFDDLTNQNGSPYGAVHVGEVPILGNVPSADIENFVAGHVIPVDDSQISQLITRYGRIYNTGIGSLPQRTVPVGSTADDVDAPEEAQLSYSDGSSRAMPLTDWDYSSVDFSTPGTYTVTGKVKQTDYPLPFAEDRADPTIRAWTWNHDGVSEEKFLMIATNDINGDNVWQAGSPHMPIRMADSIMELADTPGDPSGLIDRQGFNPKESTLRQAGDTNADGEVITGSFWAPELHEINGTLSILFMPSYNSVWSDGASAIMQLKKDENGDDRDPTLRESWTDPKTVTRADGSPISQRVDGSVGMSLDMTYFTDEQGNAYYSWQQLGANYIATVDPADPYTLTSDPVLIVSPEYAWDNAIAEGPNVINRDGTLYMIYSGSAVGRSYTTGLAMADASGNTNLLDPDAWTKLNYPIQKSGIFNGEWQLGTGHGIWSSDEDGQMLYVFHAYANPTEGYTNVGGRDTFVRRVHWAADGLPIFDMDMVEEVAPGTVATFELVVEPAVDPTDPAPTDEPTGEPTDPTDPQPTDPATGLAVTVKNASLAQGAQQSVVGTGFDPDESVTISIKGVGPVGTFTSDANGTVSVTWTIPKNVAVGDYVVELVGANSGSVSASFTVVAAGEPVSEGPVADGDTNKPLSRTGAAVGVLVALSIVLASAGALLYVRARRYL